MATVPGVQTHIQTSDTEVQREGWAAVSASGLWERVRGRRKAAVLGLTLKQESTCEQ